MLFINFSNGFFHLVYSVTQMRYMPGVVTGTLLNLSPGIMATGYAVQHHDNSNRKVLLAFCIGTGAGFLPFIHVWVMRSIG